MEKTKSNIHSANVAIDIAKLIMAYLVVAIHIEPFGFSYMADKAFGIFTRMCVPFFFLASGYFFFIKDKNPTKYIKRIFLLYLVWSIIYLPFDIPELTNLSVLEILKKYLWTGNGHALWYLCGTLVGFVVVYALHKFLKPKAVFAICTVLLIIGGLKSTYAPLLEKLLNIDIVDFLGSRNGLFYASAYLSLGLLVAKTNTEYEKPRRKNIIGFIVSFILLCVESSAMVLVFHTEATIIWISVLPLTYNFFMIVKSIRLPISQETSLYCRKLSTLIYVSHCIMPCILPGVKNTPIAFLAVAAVSTGFGALVLFLGRYKAFAWLKYIG